MRAPAVVVVVALLGACSRTDLDLAGSAPDAGAPVAEAGPVGRDAGPLPDVAVPQLCGTLPPLPSAPCPSWCLFDPELSRVAVLAAIAGTQLLAVTEQGLATTLHAFAGTGSVLYRGVSARGGLGGASCQGAAGGPLIAAMLVTTAGTTSVRVELVVVDGFGQSLVAHDETLDVGSLSGSLFAVRGNAAGTFAFGLGLGSAGRVWLALAPQKLLLPAIEGYALPYPGVGVGGVLVEPDARARLLAMKWPGDGTQYAWLDPCSGAALAPSALASRGTGAAWGSRLAGLLGTDFVTESADGVQPYPVAGLSAQAGLWGYAAPGVAMFDVPPFPAGPSLLASLATVDVASRRLASVRLSYPTGLQPAGGAFLSEVGDSNDPAGFGVDSSGEVTMFLSSGSPEARLYATADGATWSPVGGAVDYDASYAPFQTLGFAEASGTWIVRGSGAGGTPAWQLARPAAGLQATLGGPGSISRDGACAASLGAPEGLDVIDVGRGGGSLHVKLPAPVTAETFVSTWIPGDDAAIGPAF